MAKATWLWIKGSAWRARCWVDESWRRSRHQWLCRQVLLDFTTAVLCFLVMIWLTSLSRAQVPWKSWLAALLSTFGLATVFYGLLAATRFLVEQSDYESLVSAAKPPRLDRISQSEGGSWSHAISLCHRYPLTAVLLFAGLVGLNIAVWLRRSVGPDVRMVLLKALEPIPPFAYGGRLLCGSIDEPFWLWRWLLTFLFSLIAWKIVTAWLQRNEVRNRFVAGLFTENRRGPSAYGLTHGESTKEPHEQVLLDQSKRIGAAALPYLRVTLGAEEWKGAEADPDRCRGVPAVLSRVFHSDGKWCWEGFPEESRWITTWLLSHLESLVGRDLRAAPDEPAGDVTPSDHRLGEALVAAASAIASFRFRPKLDASKASDASHLEMQSKQASKCREHLRAAFAAAPRRPELLLAACGAAERLGTADDLLTPSPNPEPALVRESPCPVWGWKGFSDEEATQCRADRWPASTG